MEYEKIQLENDEEIIRVVRRHWFFMFKQSIVIILFIFLPLITLTLFQMLIPGSASALRPYGAYILFIYSFWLLLNWMILASIWTNQYLDIWCVTNKRIIKINQVRLFKRQVASFRLERLQNLDIEISGIIATFLDFGTIRAQTASADAEEFKESYLPKPQELKTIILQAADAQMRANPL